MAALKLFGVKSDMRGRERRAVVCLLEQVAAIEVKPRGWRREERPGETRLDVGQRESIDCQGSRRMATLILTVAAGDRPKRPVSALRAGDVRKLQW